MAEVYHGIIKNGTVVLPEDVKLPDGLEVAIIILNNETSEEAAWAALSAEAWEQDWVEEDADLIKEE